MILFITTWLLVWVQ